MMHKRTEKLTQTFQSKTVPQAMALWLNIYALSQALVARAFASHVGIVHTMHIYVGFYTSCLLIYRSLRSVTFGAVYVAVIFAFCFVVVFLMLSLSFSMLSFVRSIDGFDQFVPLLAHHIRCCESITVMAMANDDHKNMYRYIYSYGLHSL